MFTKQHTIARPVSVSGVGLHTGAAVTLTFLPAPENHGFVFRRSDLPGMPLVKADADLVVDTSRGTTLAQNGAQIHTVEHTLAALVGLQIDNVLIDLDGPEPPIMDGSSQAFLSALLAAGLQEQGADRFIYEIREPIFHQEHERSVELAALPAQNYMTTVMVDYNSNVLKAQHAYLNDIARFQHEIADSRTFVFLHEIEALHKAGLIKGGSVENALVIADRQPETAELERLASLFGKTGLTVEQGILNNVQLRHENEPARHKLLDLIGDLALVGTPIRGHVMAARPGHKANVALAKKIKAQIKQDLLTAKYQKNSVKGVIFDINAIERILPHRYPFLLVDKIVDFSENKIVGIKNVTANEPFFQGHFPNNPIMPGVLQIEAMAQVGGILLLNQVENPETVWVYLVGVENARFRRTVVPGDVLEFRLELLALKRGVCKMKGEAFVDGNLACSAELTASIVPKSK